MLDNQDEIWFWDPSTNIVERRANKRMKPKKDKKGKKEQNRKRENQEKKAKSKKSVQAARSNRKVLTSSDDMFWQKAQINRGASQREESSITLGNPAEAIEKTLGIKLSVPNSKRKLKTPPLNHSLSLSSVFGRSKGSSSPSVSSSSASSESEAEETVKTTHKISKLRIIPLKLKKSSRSSSSSGTSANSSNTITNCSHDSTPSVGSSASSSTNTSPVTTPRSSTDSPVTTPRANLFTPRLHMGLRGSSYNLGSPRSYSTPSSPNLATEGNDKGIAGIRPRVPPLALDNGASSFELELQSMEESSNDGTSEKGFWVCEPVYCPPVIQIRPTPYFDMILKSFDDCL